MILKRLVGIVCSVFIIFITVGFVKYYAQLIQGLDLTGITFYSVITIIIVFKLGDWVRESSELIFEKNVKTKQT